MTNEHKLEGESVFGAKRKYLYFKLPDARRERLFAEIRPKFAAKTIMAIAASTLLAMSFFFGQAMSTKDAPDQIAGEVVSAHVHSLMVGHLSDIASSDRHTVKPWFDGKLDFSPQVKDLSAAGFPLVGGRLDYIGSRSVAALVYKHRKHVINLMQWPVSESDGKPTFSTRRGYQMYTWTASGIKHWLISDLNGGDLQKFVNLLLNKS